jgi:hypothetical protein
MKISKNLFFTAFVAVNVIFIFLQIHKQSTFVKLSYEKQRLEKEKEELTQTKETLSQKLYELKNPSNVKKYAINKLNMEKIKLNQIKKIAV